MDRRTTSNLLRYIGHFVAAGAVIGLILLAANNSDEGVDVSHTWLAKGLIAAAIGGAAMVAVGILLRYLPKNTRQHNADASKS